MLKEFIHSKEEARRALLGTIFADGSIARNRKGNYLKDIAPLEITHTSKNLDYLKAVQEIIEYLNMKSHITEYNKVSETKTYSLYRLSTWSYEWLKDIRDQIYNKNRIKLFPREFIDQFTDLSLLLLYLDDGTLRVRFYKNSDKLREARITFCLDSFTYSELSYFQKYLKDKWNVETKLYRHSKNIENNRGYRLWTNTQNTRAFMAIIDKFYTCIPSMQYKFLKYYSL